MRAIDVELREKIILYNRGEFAMTFCVEEVQGAKVNLYFEIRLRGPDNAHLFTLKPYIWETEILTPFEFDVSEEGEAENLLTITVSACEGSRASLIVVPPSDWEAIPERDIRDKQ
jgi:hypothetical protein